MTRRCLILSHGFNMDGRASSQTITDKLPHFIDKGYQLFVLSAITGAKDSRFPHRQLLAIGPSGFRFDFRHWLAIRFGRGIAYKIFTALVSIILLPFSFLEKLLIGLSSQWSWTIPAVIFGFIWIKSKKINLIYSTGGAWSAHLAGWVLKKITKVDWIVEIHDPLVVRHHANDDGFSPRKTRDARFLQWLEKKICSDSDFVWWFTEGALSYAKKRNPQLKDRGFYFLPGAEPPLSRAEHQYGNILNISHFGSLANSRSLLPLLRALPKFFELHESAKQQLKIHIYGSSLDHDSMDFLIKSNLENILVVHGRLEYDPITNLSGRAQISQFMHTADYLLLLHGNYEGCSEYIPSKLYEYWWASRPILGITHINPQLDSLIAEINGTAAYTAHTEDSNQITSVLSAAYKDWLAKKKFILFKPPLGVNTIVNQIHDKLESRK